MFVIVRTIDRMFVAWQPPGRERGRAYTRDLEQAKRYQTREDAAADCWHGREYLLPVED